MPKSIRPRLEDVVDGVGRLGVNRLKLVATFFTALLVVYSFFGNIYKIPMQLDQAVHKLEQLEQSHKDDLAILKSLTDSLAARSTDNAMNINTLQVQIKHVENDLNNIKRKINDSN